MRVLVVDDHPLIHEVMRAVLTSAFKNVSVHSAPDLAAATAQARRGEPPELVIMDLGLPGCSGVEAVIRFRQSCPNVPVVVLSASVDRPSILGALKAGAVGYIPKTSDKKVIVAALGVVAAGGTYVPAELVANEIAPDRSLQHADDRSAVELTGRQRDVLRLLLEGYSNQKIASELNITESTVKQHAKAVYDAFGVSTRAQMLVAATRRGFGDH